MQVARWQKHDCVILLMTLYTINCSRVPSSEWKSSSPRSASRSYVSSIVRLEEELGENKRQGGTRLETPGQQTSDKPNADYNYRQENKQSAQMVMMFTCGKCDVRSVKSFSKVAYTRGVVLVECPGCRARHLIADNLGWFGEKGTVQDFAKANGHVVRTQEVDGTLELTPEQILGDSKLAQLTGQDCSKDIDDASRRAC